MTRLRFMTVSADPRPDHVGVVYGPGHETDFVEEDYEYVKTLRLEGKAEVLDDTPELVAALFKAPEPDRPGPPTLP